jgi:hypothetical protein
MAYGLWFYLAPKGPNTLWGSSKSGKRLRNAALTRNRTRSEATSMLMIFTFGKRSLTNSAEPAAPSTINSLTKGFQKMKSPAPKARSDAPLKSNVKREFTPLLPKLFAAPVTLSKPRAKRKVRGER